MVDELTAELLAAGPFVRSAAPYRLLAVGGADAGDFLQRLCSQDVLGPQPGRGAPAAFLDAKGKLLVVAAVQRLGESFWLETRSEQHDELVQLLERYHFTEQLEFEAPADWVCREIIGSSAAGVGDAITFTLQRRGVTFVRMHGPAATLGEPAGAPLSDELAECLRMAAGFVRVGLESEPNTLALEADLGDHCSTTKGCYTGQEIVARIHTYGHTNRKLCLLHLPDGEPIATPEPLHELEDGIPVGRVMHAVPIAVGDRRVRYGLGYLPPDFQPPGTVVALADGGRCTVVW